MSEKACLTFGMNTKFLLSLLLLLLSLLPIRADDRMDFAGANDRATAVIMAADYRPVPFLGTDGMVHLDYEVQLINTRTTPVRIESFEVLDGERGDDVLLKISGSELKNYLALIDRTPADTLGASQAGIFWLDVRLKPDKTLPRTLRHRITTITLEKGLSPAATPADAKPVQTVETAGEIAISAQPALVLGPPLEGTGWGAASSCCTSYGHRRAGLPINGTLFVGQRFAIDWIKLDAQRRFVSGSITNNHDYVTYGQRAIAVADATVASVLDGLPERVAGQLPPDTTLQNVTGNHVILDLGGSRYGFYAHLQPGSIKVKKGDKVKKGEVLALVGNSGNTTGPHLHFHVMDGLTALGSQGLPYVIDSFTLEGIAPEIADLDFTKPVPITPKPPQDRKNQYPLDNAVVDFPMAK